MSSNQKRHWRNCIYPCIFCAVLKWTARKIMRSGKFSHFKDCGVGAMPFVAIFTLWPNFFYQSFFNYTSNFLCSFTLTSIGATLVRYVILLIRAFNIILHTADHIVEFFCRYQIDNTFWSDTMLLENAHGICHARRLALRWLVVELAFSKLLHERYTTAWNLLRLVNFRIVTGNINRFLPLLQLLLQHENGTRQAMERVLFSWEQVE